VNGRNEELPDDEKHGTRLRILKTKPYAEGSKNAKKAVRKAVWLEKCINEPFGEIYDGKS